MRKFDIIMGGKVEFEVHRHGCQHVARIDKFSGSRQIHRGVEAESAEALVDEWVAAFEEQDQGWTHGDFGILPCCHKGGAA